MSDFRCAAASEQREDDLAGTASTVHSFLLVQSEGPWGRDALTESRLPDGLGAQLKARAARARVRPLLMRQGRSADAGTRIIAACVRPPHPWLESAVLDDPSAVLDLDLAALASGESVGLPRLDEPVFAVCTHGRHDICCALRGRPTVAALKQVRPGQTWEVSHIGGDRFAGNLLVLPHGLYYGRVDADSGPRIAAAYARGHLDLDHFRGRSSYSRPVQAADIALRRELAHTGIEGLQVLGHTTVTGNTRTSFSVTLEDSPPRYFTVTISTHASEEHYPLTCHAVQNNSIPRFELRSIRENQ